MDSLNLFIDKISSLELNTQTRIAISIGIILVFFLIRPMLSYLMIKVFKIKSKKNERINKSAFYKPLNIFFLILGIYLAIIFLNVPKDIIIIVNKLFSISVIILIASVFSNALKIDSIFLKPFLKKSTLDSNPRIIKLVTSCIRIIIYCVAGVIVISELGYDINGLIAGLGISGLTIALAAQDTAKNLFGGLVVLLDKPFSIGEWIKTEHYEGIVEEITFRSTRIRTWDDTVATVPNSEIVNSPVLNCTKMNVRRIKINLILEFNTKLKQVCDFTNDVENLLNEYDILKDSIVVKFSDIDDNGYKILISFKTPLKKYADYMNLKETINYKIMQLLEKNKIDLAYPSQTIYVKKP